MTEPEPYQEKVEQAHPVDPHASVQPEYPPPYADRLHPENPAVVAAMAAIEARARQEYEEYLKSQR